MKNRELPSTRHLWKVDGFRTYQVYAGRQSGQVGKAEEVGFSLWASRERERPESSGRSRSRLAQSENPTQEEEKDRALHGPSRARRARRSRAARASCVSRAPAAPLARPLSCRALPAWRSVRGRGWPGCGAAMRPCVAWAAAPAGPRYGDDIRERDCLAAPPEGRAATDRLPQSILGRPGRGRRRCGCRDRPAVAAAAWDQRRRWPQPLAQQGQGFVRYGDQCPEGGVCSSGVRAGEVGPQPIEFCEAKLSRPQAGAALVAERSQSSAVVLWWPVASLVPSGENVTVVGEEVGRNTANSLAAVRSHTRMSPELIVARVRPSGPKAHLASHPPCTGILRISVPVASSHR